MSMSGDSDSLLKSVRQLEDEFAEAMSRMYTVGNDLARLRARLIHDASPQQWTPVPGPPPPGGAPHAPMAQPPSSGPAAQGVPPTPLAPGVPTPSGHAAATAPTQVSPPPATPASPPQSAAAPETRPAPGTVTAPPVAHAPFAGAHAPTPPAHWQESTPWWQRDGVVARLLAVVGTGITLIGVAFLLALAIQMGFFGPLARVLSGALLAVALIGAAVFVRRRQSSTAGALGLAATGIATAYLDVIAITSIYEWVPVAAGLVIAGLVAVGGLLLARAWGSEVLASLTVLGVAALAPGIAHDHMLLVGQFLLVLTIASWPAQISRQWYVLELSRILPTAFVITLLPLFGEAAGHVALLAGLLAGFVLVTGLAGVRIAAAPAQSGLTVPAVAIPVLSASLALERAPGTTLMTALTLALVAVGILTAGRLPTQTPAKDTLLLTGCALYTAGPASLVAAALLADGTDWPLAAVLAVCALWAGVTLALRSRTILWVTGVTSILPLLLSLVLVPYTIDRGLSWQVEPAHLVTAALTVVLLTLLAQAITVTHPAQAVFATRTLLAGALLGAGGTVILAGVLLGGLADDPRGGFTAGQAAATVLWLATAAVLLLRGLRGSTFAVPAGLAITAISVGKLLFFDLAFLDGIPRVLSFIVGGLIVLGMGTGYAHALERSRAEAEPVDNSGSETPTPPTV